MICPSRDSSAGSSARAPGAPGRAIQSTAASTATRTLLDVEGRGIPVRLAGGVTFGRLCPPPAARDPTGGDVLVTKQQWGAFHGTALDLELRRRGITQVALCGIATSIGVESTARAAHEHGYHVTVATDAITDMDADAHRNSLEKIFPRLGETGTTDAITELLG
ncbi:isochorismatase family protein [Streptomyces sp. NPDC006516]|uniref:isochorismatase family protein n=1 Tax=Streptomyces sp. NPDC006516 TaxID=3154309 RepID=UPI0033BA0708